MKKDKFLKILKLLKYIIPITLLICFVVSLIITINIYCKYNTKVTSETLSELNLDKATNLMIVAHPDDETIWGGAHLLEGNYFVVCLTNKYNEVRAQEFLKIMEKSGNTGLILTYPDKILGKRSNWYLFRNSIKNNIKTILDYKDWNTIVTHNLDGEYGHIHHKITNSIVTAASKDTDNFDRLYYFGKYYKKGAPNLSTNPISDETLAKKKELLSYYESQGFIDNSFGHMYPFENFMKASDVTN